jgi:hypothetical protein
MQLWHWSACRAWLLTQQYIPQPSPLARCPQDAQAPGGWALKPKAAFLQTPQDFWNVEAADPMVHCARFFYGPMLQVGRAPAGLLQGLGPCCWCTCRRHSPCWPQQVVRADEHNTDAPGCAPCRDAMA